LRSPENLSYLFDDVLALLSPQICQIICYLKENPDFTKAINTGQKIETPELSNELNNLLNYLLLKSEVEEDKSSSSPFANARVIETAGLEINEECKDCLREIKSLEIKNKLEQISQEIKKAEKEKDTKKINDLTKNFTDTATQLTNL